MLPYIIIVSLIISTLVLYKINKSTSKCNDCPKCPTNNCEERDTK